MGTKEALIALLKAGAGGWISGERLSGKLGVSRAAVWKHIRGLKAAGYDIVSSPRKGYLLGSESDVVSAREIREGLTTRVLGKEKIICLKETDSTNTRAKELAAGGANQGTVVIAEKQTQGRGRKGRRWCSPPGQGIYLSIILRPRLSPVEAPKITLMTAVAVAEALLSVTDLPVRIKWPNDILVGGKKIAGILTEISTEVDAVDYIVVGLGLNVNTPRDRFDAEIREIATSILAETGSPCSRIDLIRAFLQIYETWYETFIHKGFEPILRRWKSLSDFIGRQVRVDVLGKRITGRVSDIDPDGVLILTDDAGEPHRIISGDVTLL